MTDDLPAARPVDRNQVRDVPHIPAPTLVVAILVLIVSPFVVLLSLFMAMAAGECRPDDTCDDVGRWWVALNTAAWAIPAIAVLALLATRAARSPTGRVAWTLSMFAPPIAWLVILVNIPI